MINIGDRCVIISPPEGDDVISDNEFIGRECIVTGESRDFYGDVEVEVQGLLPKDFGENAKVFCIDPKYLRKIDDDSQDDFWGEDVKCPESILEQFRCDETNPYETPIMPFHRINGDGD